VLVLILLFPGGGEEEVDVDVVADAVVVGLTDCSWFTTTVVVSSIPLLLSYNT